MQEKIGLSSVRVRLMPTQKDVQLTSAEWNIVVASQNASSAEQVVLKLKMDPAAFVAASKKIGSMGLLKFEKIEPQASVSQDNPVPEEFWNSLEAELSRHIGPIASAVIDDELDALKITPQTAGKNHLFILVENLSREIGSSTSKVDFQKKMTQFIRKI
ncbi:MAG: hypothetical protein EOM25_04655 [Deltaproteobacteria bacterium]|nr:hypothetical protein [Deltaproteobacteria bacterium]